MELYTVTFSIWLLSLCVIQPVCLTDGKAEPSQVEGPVPAHTAYCREEADLPRTRRHRGGIGSH